MAFITIHPTEGLSAAELERAIKTGPPEVWAEAPHEEMLASAGFIDVEAIDVTAAFSLTQQAWVDGWREHEDELVDLLGTRKGFLFIMAFWSVACASHGLAPPDPAAP